MSLLCRFCKAPLQQSFCDLGVSPLSNANLQKDQLNSKEPFYPLHAFICTSCLLVQLDSFEAPDHIFNNHYAYFSSYSDSWLSHASTYVDKMVSRLGLNSGSQVVEIASNDGYLLQYFVKKKIPALGVEPSANVAEAARGKGIQTVEAFFGVETANRLVKEGKSADLLLGNNVLAHVPDLNDFVAGLKILLKDQGVITMEFPHILQLIQKNQFDTIYHEHFSYFSITTVEQVFAAHGLTLFDVEELETHGGSLRIFARHAEDISHPAQKTVEAMKEKEKEACLDRPEGYLGFEEKVRECKKQLLDFFHQAKREGKRIAGYGAPAKGNTLLNFCGIGADSIEYTVDRNPNKQGLYLPGSHIPVRHPDEINKNRPDYILILPWNIKEEIMKQLSYVREWGGKFVLPIPKVEVLD